MRLRLVRFVDWLYGVGERWSRCFERLGPDKDVNCLALVAIIGVAGWALASWLRGG